MPALIAILGLILAAGVWAWRLRMAKQALDDVSGIAGDVIAAARRLGFRRRMNAHPVESIEEPSLAISALGLAFLDLASLPTAEQLKSLKQAVRKELAVSEIKTDEMLIVSRWLVNECKTPQMAIGRLGKRLAQLDRTGFQPLLAVLGGMEGGTDTLSPRQRDALDEIARIFRLN
ncbi:hypothetical protein [Paracoccus sp. TOH]|uniref:hypothetical protein n=1 Tax=Paracoccus sp. TOH TaxID=1263728 RepID=UPI0025B24BD9|nr:hypothetical protein [Paracoccus sp. TOH]WJS84236.1 hypothetical protein NBE95_00135 [Paracoccus sp. TOH]